MRCLDGKLPARQLDLEENDVYTVESALGISDLMGLLQARLPTLEDRPYTPIYTQRCWRLKRVSSTLSSGRNVLLHHPYESFTPGTDFIRTAAMDPNGAGH
jgi:polyphosphate kinase